MQTIVNFASSLLPLVLSGAVIGWLANTLSTISAVRSIRKGSRLSLIAHGIHELADVIDKEND